MKKHLYFFSFYIVFVSDSKEAFIPFMKELLCNSATNALFKRALT